MTRTAEERVLKRVDSLQEELLELVAQLIRIPTVNPPGQNYRECAALLGNKLQQAGFQVLYLPAEGFPEHTAENPRINVLARLDGRHTRPLLHLNGHMDVVPAGNGWTCDPFGGHITDGKIFGRGACDTKSGLAACVCAAEAIVREGLELQGTLEISGSVDEESGGFAGLGYLARSGYVHRDRTDFVIITEPLDVNRICIGHRGVLWTEVVVKGRIAHGSMPFLGVSAIDQMARFLGALEQELRPRLATLRTQMPVVPEAARQATLNINSIRGGQFGSELQTPCVADSCRVVLDRRFLIEENVEQVSQELREILERLATEHREFRYELRNLMAVDPVQTDPQAAVVQAVSAGIEKVLGQKPTLVASPGTYDQKHVVREGHLRECIAYGPGILDVAHQPDEYCHLRDLVNSAKVLALSILRLLS